MAGQVTWFEDLFRSLVSMLTVKEPTRCLSLCIYVAASCVEEMITNAGIDVGLGVSSETRFRDF